jgi:putative Mg2+ transporter-C (MgtC) family protein
MEMGIIDILLRFLITFIASLLFGIDRQRSHKPIGFGTFIFVSVGSCGLAITALSLSMQNTAENPIPLLGAIVTGIGFLGAGGLIKTTDRIFGFTTAASIWLFAIFGLIIGVGEYLTGAVMYLSVWTVVFYDKYLERQGIGSYQKKITICTNRIINESEIQTLIGTTKCKLITIHMDKKDSKLHVTYLIEGMKEDIEVIPRKLLGKDWFDHCKIE